MKVQNCPTIKINKIMKDFIREACDLTYHDMITGEELPKIISLNKAKEFLAMTPTYDYVITDYPLVEIGYNLDQLYEGTITSFRKHWMKKYPMIKGFSNATLAILHELGHWEMHDETCQYCTWEDRVNMMEEVGEKMKQGEFGVNEANELYFDFFDEAVATEWAMMWLSEPENRKIAKAFEKKFFACFTEI